MSDPIGADYNIWREWTEKYARRIEKIKKNPNPNMAKSNIILYEMMYDQAKRELDAWESGSEVPVMYCNENSPIRLYMSMGFRTYHIEMFADRHPSTAKLVVEVAVNSEELDRAKACVPRLTRENRRLPSPR